MCYREIKTYKLKIYLMTTTKSQHKETQNNRKRDNNHYYNTFVEVERDEK